MTKRMGFTRTIEDFVCEKCGGAVQGNGYTNHCPKCLWSKHVDVSPGDRASLCGGLMEPKGVVVSSGTHRIFHTCTICGFTRAQETSKEDDMKKIIELSTRPVS